MAGDIEFLIGELQAKLEVHIAAEQERGKKVDEMYKVLVVGNGIPSIKERVNQLEKNMLDKDTAKELEVKIDRLEKSLPDPKEWSKIKLWSEISLWVMGLVIASWIAQLAPKILSHLQTL